MSKIKEIGISKKLVASAEAKFYSGIGLTAGKEYVKLAEHKEQVAVISDNGYLSVYNREWFLP